MLPDSGALLWRLVAKGASPIVPLNEGEGGLPLYFVHSIGGEIASYSELARLLSSKQRIYGIQVPQEKLSAGFASSIQSIAEYYVDTLIAFQREGPVALGGWSVGSVIALEMAQQLQARGRTVRLLVVFDGILANTGAGLSTLNPLYYWKLVCNLPRWAAHDLLEDWQLSNLIRRGKRKLLLALATLVARGESSTRYHSVDGFVNTRAWPPAQASFARTLYDAAMSYVPRAYHGQVLVFAANTQPLYHLLQIVAAWKKIATSIETVEIAGTHLNILRHPRIINVSHQLSERLRKFDVL